MQSPTKRIMAEEDDEDSVSDYQDAVFTKRGCCIWLPCLRKWDRIGTDRDDSRGWNWNVLLKWKAVIRRIRMNRFRNGRRRFRYDELSYALNFDESAIENQRSSCCDVEFLRREFSMRYASINSGSSKMLMDVGRAESSAVC